MRRCGRCDVANAETNHFCTHCGDAFPCECTVCYHETTRYGRCGHALCAACDLRLPKRACPTCRASLAHVVVYPSPTATTPSELDALIADMKRFRLDLIHTLMYRCFRRRFTSHVQYDAKFLIRPILSIPRLSQRAHRLVPQWERILSLANADVAFMHEHRERLADLDLHDKDDAFFIMVHLRALYE